MPFRFPIYGDERGLCIAMQLNRDDEIKLIIINCAFKFGAKMYKSPLFSL